MRAFALGAVFVAAAAAAAVALLPLQVGLRLAGAEGAGLSARAVSGTIWGGTMHDAGFRGLPLGDAAIGLGPTGLRISTSGPVSGKGRLTAGGGGIGLAGFTGRAPLSLIASGLPVDGVLNLQGADLVFGQGGCRRAAGTMAIEAPRLAGAFPLPGLTLAGPLACEGGVLTAPLSGEAAGARVDMDVRLDGAGAYRVRTSVRLSNPTLAALAGLAGFQRGVDGFTREDSGRLGS